MEEEIYILGVILLGSLWGSFGNRRDVSDEEFLREYFRFSGFVWEVKRYTGSTGGLGTL